MLQGERLTEGFVYTRAVYDCGFERRSLPLYSKSVSCFLESLCVVSNRCCNSVCFRAVIL